MEMLRNLLLTSGVRFFFWVSVLTASSLCADQPRLTEEQQAWLKRAKRLERAGWIYVHVEGAPQERGFQHGYLLAKEIQKGLRNARVGWEHQSGMSWAWLVEQTVAMFGPKIDAECLDELEGIASGVRAAGMECSKESLMAYNGLFELGGYWWPIESKKWREGPAPAVKESCSSFIAVGSMTRDGNVVIGHNTMTGYGDVLPNIVMDLVPSHGHRIFWQTLPGWIHSGTDFFMTDAGLVGSETTIGAFEGFDPKGIPEFVRMRRATQDASSLEEWCEKMKAGNNGGYANAWLLGDIHRKEILRLELGLRNVALERTKDGYFSGSNVAEDLKILRFETSASDGDIRVSSVARRVRWKQLMAQYRGKIDAITAKRFEADHYDAYLNKTHAGGRSLCGHFELDREPAGPWPGVPFGCAGTLDGKVADASMVSEMSFEGRWGSACGRPFRAKEFLSAHPQHDWLQGVLEDRPSQPWVKFRAGE